MVRIVIKSPHKTYKHSHKTSCVTVIFALIRNSWQPVRHVVHKACHTKNIRKRLALEIVMHLQSQYVIASVLRTQSTVL